MQDKSWIFVPRLPLDPEQRYNLRFQSETIRFLKDPFEFSFKTRAEDRVTPIGLFYNPASGSELILAEMNQKVLEITFSESVFACHQSYGKHFKLCSTPACHEQDILMKIDFTKCDFSSTTTYPCYFPGKGSTHDFTMVSLYPTGHTNGVVNAWAEAGMRLKKNLKNISGT